MNNTKSFILFCSLLLSNALLAQFGNNQSFGASGSTSLSKHDSVPAEIQARIYSFLESRGISSKQHIANLNNEKYLVVVALKQDEETMVIWSDYHFNAKGACFLVRTTIASKDDVDCDALGTTFCERIAQLNQNYKKAFQTDYTDYIYFFEKPSGSHFEVFYPQNSAQAKVVKFDAEGTLMEE